MSIPAIERLPYQRPASVDMVPSGAGRAIPVAPVNPANPVNPVVTAAESVMKAASSPDVINLINQSGNKPNVGEGVYYSVSDPAKRGTEASTAEKDWTIRRPEATKSEVPPPEPISKMLLAFLRDMWRASGSAIEVQIAASEAKTQAQNPGVAPGTIAKEVLTYSPTKISSTEKSLAGNPSRDSTSR